MLNKKAILAVTILKICVLILKNKSLISEKNLEKEPEFMNIP